MMRQDFVDEIKKLKQENEKLKECVEFYADKKNAHGSKSSIVYEIDVNKKSYSIEIGNMARQTLKEINSAGNSNE